MSDRNVLLLGVSQEEAVTIQLKAGSLIQFCLGQSVIS